MAVWPQSMAHESARVPPDPPLHTVRPLQGTTRKTVAGGLVHTALGGEAAAGALEDFAESDPGPATPRRRRR